MGERGLPDLRAARRVLIIRLSSIGDVVHALPVAAALRETFPHLELTWVVEEMSAEIVVGSPVLKDVIVIPRGRWKRGRLRSWRVWREYGAFLADLRARRFDVTLDLQGYAKSGLIALATGAKYRLGWHRLRDLSGLVSRALPKRDASVHRVDWFLDAARTLGANAEPARFPLFVPEAAHARVQTLLCAGGLETSGVGTEIEIAVESKPEMASQTGATSRAAYAVLNPAVGDLTRRWGAARYAALTVELAERLHLPVVLTGSAKDRAICDAVRDLALADGRIANAGVAGPLSLAGQTDLKELAALLQGARVHVCGDTGSAHIAAAVGCPVVALYGPTDPAHAGPYGANVRVLSNRSECAPDCTVRRCARLTTAAQKPADGNERNGPARPERTTREQTAPCLATITPEAVFAQVELALHDREA